MVDLNLFLSSSKTTGGDLLILLKKHYILKFWFSQPVGGSDNFNLEEHTALVLKNYETYYSKNRNLFSDSQFKVFLAFHDIGKPKAFLENMKFKQHEYSINIINSLSSELNMPNDLCKKIKVIIDGDPIGRYLDKRYNISINASLEIAYSMANKLNLSIQEIWENLIVYYQCDAAGYYSLRNKIFLTDFNDQLIYSNEKQRLLFKEEEELKISILEKTITLLK